MPAATPAAYVAVRAQGPDAQRFLQSQLTQDVVLAAVDRTRLAGWADPKGRLQWVGHLWRNEDGYALLAPATLVDDFLAGLRRFVLRSKVTLDLAPAAVVPAGTAGAVVLAGDPRRGVLVVPGGAAPADALSTDDCQLADIRAGLPTLAAATRGEFVPQMLNLDLLDGISFTKGCYPGQEIVARTKYLGRVKRRMLRFATTGPAPSPGEPVHGPKGPAGQVVSAAATPAGVELLAVIMLDGWPGPFRLGDARELESSALPYAVPELAGS
jgi:tRNA-modifying protein YgfZ